jgi:centromere protein J
MRNDLEDLITYIDGLTFESKASGSPQHPSHQQQEKVSSFEMSSPRAYQSIFRDRTNNRVNAISPTNNNDNNEKKQKSQPDPSETVRHEKTVSNHDHMMDRLEPAGSQPYQEASLYFHDESLSMILSKSSDDVDGIDGVTGWKRTSTPTRLLSTLQTSGIVPNLNDNFNNNTSVRTTTNDGKRKTAKGISFYNVAKDPTPSKYVEPSRDNGSSTVTPLPSRSSLLQHLLGDSSPNNDNDSASEDDWHLTPKNNPSIRLELSCKSRRGTPHPRIEHDDESAEEEQHVVSYINGMETPKSQQPSSSSPSSFSPESAKKLLLTAVDALKDARQERESARQWAQDIKEAVQQWVEEQRQLIRTESVSVTAATTASSAQVQQLEQSMQKLHREITRTNTIRSDTDRKLEELIEKQSEKIEFVVRQLDVMKKQIGSIAVNEVSIDGNLGDNRRQRKVCPTANLNRFGTSPSHTHCESQRRLVDKSTPKSNVSNSNWSETSLTSSHTNRTRRRTPNGGHMVDYGNGVTKEVHPDGTTVTRFINGDVETRFGDSLSTPTSSELMRAPTKKAGIVAYFHCKEGVLQITQNDGSVLYEYPNGQIERHYRDGLKVVLFPDGTKKVVGVVQQNGK